MEPLRGVWDWEKVEDLEVLIAPAGGKFGGSSVIGLTWRGGTFAEFYRKVSASPPPRPPPIIFFKPFTSDLASPLHTHIHPYPSLFLGFPLRGFSLKLLRFALGFAVVLRGRAGRLWGCAAAEGSAGRLVPVLRATSPSGRSKPAPLGLSSPRRARLAAKRRKGKSPAGQHPGTS